MPTSAESKLTIFLKRAYNDEAKAAQWIKSSIEDDMYFVDEAADKAKKAKASDILYLTWVLNRTLTHSLINENRFLLLLRGLFLVSSRIDSVSSGLKASEKDAKALKNFAHENGEIFKRIKELYRPNSGEPKKNRPPYVI